MKKNRSGDTILAGILRPLPAFIIVTTMTALAFGVPSFQEVVESFTVASYGMTSVILHLLLPPATGLLAALGIYLGFSERSSSPETSETDPFPEGGMSPDERLRAILRNLPVSVLTLSPDRRVSFRNPEAIATFYGEKEGGEDGFLAFIERAGLGSFLDRVLDGSGEVIEEAQDRGRSDGALPVFRINGVPIIRNQRVVEAMFLVEDVSDWKSLREDLSQSEERYRNIFSHAACGIFFVDQNGNYLDANPAALDMLGYSRDELLRLNTRELSADSEQRIRKLRQTPGWVVEETRYLRKDGTIVDVELAGSSFFSGSDTYFIGITKDISARKQLEKLFSAAQSTLSALIDRDGDPIVLCDREGRIWQTNGAADDLLGLPPGEHRNLLLTEALTGDPLDPKKIPVDGTCAIRVDAPGMPTVDCVASRLVEDCVEPFCVVSIRKSRDS
ncbi:MAG: PAS domain S-box protein [bacterium]|nr:MAG: PAS domain S-box protein [bacterium]